LIGNSFAPPSFLLSHAKNEHRGLVRKTVSVGGVIMSVPVGGVRRIASICRQFFVCFVAVAAAFAFSNVAMAQDNGAAAGTSPPAGAGGQRLAPITVEAPPTAKPQNGKQKQQQRSAAKRSNAASNKPRNNVAAAVTIGGVETVVFDSQRTRGAETSIDAAVTDKVHVYANATAQNAYITNNPQGITSIGNRPQGVPAYISNLWTTYKFSVAGIPGFIVGGGVNYQSTTYSDITNVNSIPAYVIGNALLGYAAPHWSVMLNVKNVTNERYFIAANAAGAYVGNPLAAYVTLRIIE
jgi:outer membrane receptor for ferric coprogen and ferric-rhodotorulic acid